MVARTLMARLPRIFRTCSQVSNKNNLTDADIIVFGIILGNCLFYTDNGMSCNLKRIVSMRRF